MKIIPNAIMMKNVTNLFSDLLINDRISFPKLFICKNHNNLGLYPLITFICIVYIFYHFNTTGVNKDNDIALQIMDIAVLRAVEPHNGRPVLGIVLAPSKARLRASDLKSPPETSASRREKRWAYRKWSVLEPWVMWTMFLPCRV